VSLVAKNRVEHKQPGDFPMAIKQTYEELEQEIIQLKNKAVMGRAFMPFGEG